MASDLRQLAVDLKEGRLLPLYVLCGEDELRKRRARQRIAKIALGDNGSEFSDEYVEDASASEIVERAATSSFFAADRVLTAGGAENYKAEDASIIAEYAQNPSEGTTLILLVRGKLDKRGKFYKTFADSDCIFDFPYLTGKDRLNRIFKEGKRMGFELDKEAIEYLDYALAADLYTVTNELEKVKLYAGDKGKITLGDIKDIVAVSRGEDIFEVVRFVGEGRGQRAVEAVHRLLAAGESELGIMALLSRQVKLFWQAKVLAASGLGKNDVAKRLKVPWSFVDEYIEGGRKLEEPRLAKLHGKLYDLDRRIKTGRITPRIALESFIAEAANN